MKKIILLIGSFLSIPLFSQYAVKGGTGAPFLKEDIQVQVYLLNGLSGAEISFTSGSGNHQWYRYDKTPGDAVPVPCLQTGNTSVVTDVRDGYGYFVDETPITYVWIIDYSRYVPDILSLNIEEDENACTFLRLTADAETQALEYRNVQGNPVSLARTYHLLYQTLEWNDEMLDFVPKDVDIALNNYIATIEIDPAPLRNTTFTLLGDQYAQHFGIVQSKTTPEYEAIALEIHTRAITRSNNGTEETFKDEHPVISGEAPLEVRLEAYANKPVAARYIWEIKKIDSTSRDSVSILRYPDSKVTYHFQESGLYAARVEVIDVQTVCVAYSNTFEIAIEDSYLRLPNAFSPGSSAGVNDIYRVSHKSLISFKASIYNRQGNLLYHWEDPNQGWDGTVSGRYVPTGVYFIIVEAKGADGTVYKRSRDINILRSKNN